MTSEELLLRERCFRYRFIRKTERAAKLTGFRLKHRWGGFQLLDRLTGEVVAGTFFELDVEEAMKICQARAIQQRITLSFRN